MRQQKLVHLLSSVPRATSERTMMSTSYLLFEAVDSPRSLAAWILLKNGEFAQLVNLEINPDNYLEAQAFKDDYLVTKFLSKYPDFRHKDLDPEKAALESFFKFEEACRATNKKFRELELDPSKWDPLMLSILQKARRKIRHVLGPVDLDRISDNFGWGPGATTAASGNLTSAYIKFSKRLDVTSNTLIIGHCCVNSTPSWVNCQLQTDEFPSIEASLIRDAFNIVRGNEIVFVPKNAKTHRIIAKEPHVNSYLQKGFGTFIRQRLRNVARIDLKDQSVNQQLALEGSLYGNLCTIDLSGASDTISSELVRFLLPEKWFSILDQLRSKQGLLKGSWIAYEKFSSMGNAYTFELESLIFWALCKSVLEYFGGAQTCNVYGDDIIVPVEHYENVVKIIDFVGFSVNIQKSFSTGVFRESCGKDFFFGTDVRPIFLKESVSNVESLFKLANSLRRYSHRRDINRGCDIRFRTAWLHAVSLVPVAFRGFLIPEGYGDVGLLVNFDEACPTLPRNGWGGFIFKGLTRHPVKQGMRDRHAGYTATLFGSRNGNRQTGEPITGQGKALRDFIDLHLVNESLPLLGHHDLRRMTLPKETRIHTHEWYDLGSWNNN